MIDWPNSLIEDLANGRCVVFLGSGVSNNAKNAAGDNPKTWKQLLEKANSKIIDAKKQKTVRRCLERCDYLMACELIKSEMGKQRFNSFLKDEFVAPRFQPADIHADIFSLDAPVVITPNVDKLYDSYVNKTDDTIPVLSYYSEDIIDYIRKGSLIVLKIHGTIDEPSKLIFTREDYARARNQYVSFYKLLEALIITRPFLFLGAGLSDPDIQLLLENANFQYGNAGKHYFVIHDKEYAEEELSVYRATLNLDFLKYDWNSRTKSHQDFLDSIKDLSKKVEAKKASVLL